MWAPSRLLQLAVLLLAGLHMPSGCHAVLDSDLAYRLLFEEPNQHLQELGKARLNEINTPMSA